MTKKCNKLADRVSINGSTYRTWDSLTSDTYCYKMNGIGFPHITVTNTGKGKSTFSKFHITWQNGGNTYRAYFCGKKIQSCSKTNNVTSFKTNVHPDVVEKAKKDMAKDFWDQLAN